MISKFLGVIFNPKIHIADFGNFKRGFLSMKLIQMSNFRGGGSKAVWNFSENSSDLSPPSFPIKDELKPGYDNV